MGYIDQSDIIAGIAAVEMTLRELDHKFELGAGVKAAMEILGNG
jgi:aspartate aminotransferase-like enzyme